MDKYTHHKCIIQTSEFLQSEYIHVIPLRPRYRILPVPEPSTCSFPTLTPPKVTAVLTSITYLNKFWLL